MRGFYNITERIRLQLAADEFVNSVTYGDIFRVDLKKQTLFPLSHVVVNNATMENNVWRYNISIMAMDIVDISKVAVPATAQGVFRGNDNEQDVLNTQFAVLNRLLEILRSGDIRNELYQLDGNPTLEPFTERFENFLAGWVATFDVLIPNDMTSCDIAVAPSEVCEDATYTLVDTLGNNLASGSIASGATASITAPDVAVEVNDVSKGNVPSGSTLDVNLNVTPTSSTLVGNVLSITVPSAPIDADAQAFLTATGITDATTTYAITFLVDNLKSKGIWNKCYGLYPLVGGTATTQKFNLKNPLNTDSAFRLEFFGGVTHDANGIQGNGVNGYLDFKIIPASHLIVNNTHACYYCTSNINEAKLDLSSQQGGDFGLYNYSSTYYTDQYNQTSGSGRVGIANSDTTGFIVGSRVASNNLKLFRNGSQIGTTATGAGGVISGMTSSVFGMAGRASATTAHLFSSRKYAFFSIGEGLTVSEQLAYNNIVQAFQTILSRNV